MALSIFSLMGSIFVDSSEAEQSISRTEEKSNKLSESFINGLENAGKWAAGLATAAASAAGALGATAVNVATDVDSAMNGFAAATGTANDELAAYEEAMLNIYNNNYGESFEDVANSMGAIKNVMGDDMGADELEKMTQNALMLRDTFEMDVAESVKAANSLMDQFGISSEEAYNLIAQGAQNGLNQNGDMLDVLNEYGVQFASMGYDAEEMFNMLANGAESGTWSVDKLADATKEFNIRMKDGSSNDALKKLGLNVDSVNKKYAAGGDQAQEATKEILAALKNVEDENERYMLGQELMGTMWEDLGEDAVYAMFETEGAISNTKDALAEINDIKYDDLGSMFEGLKRNVETLLLPLGNALIPLIMQVVQLIQNNMPIIEGIIATLTPIITELFESLIPPLMDLISSLLPPIADMITAILPSLMTFIQSLMPILIQIIDAVLPVFVDLINTLLPPIMEIINMVLPLLAQLLPPLLTLLQPIIDLLNPIIQLCMALLTPLMQLLNAILPPLISIITVLVDVALANMQSTFQAVASIISTVVNAAVSSVTTQIDNLKTIFGAVIDFFNNVFAGNWEAAFENLKTILATVFDSMVSVVKTPINAIIGVINGLVSGVCSGINAVIDALNKLQIDVPGWVEELTGVSDFGFDIDKITAPQIPLLAAGGNVMHAGSAIVGEAGAELIDLPQGARVTPLTQNGDPIGTKALGDKMDVMIDLLAAILQKEGVVQIGETQFVNYVNTNLGALL